MLTHEPRQLPSWLIFDVGQKTMPLPRYHTREDEERSSPIWPALVIFTAAGSWGGACLLGLIVLASLGSSGRSSPAPAGGAFLPAALMMLAIPAMSFTGAVVSYCLPPKTKQRNRVLRACSFANYLGVSLFLVAAMLIKL